MRSILHDLRIAIRGLGRSRLFTIVSIATIALAAGVAGSVFSVVDTLILRSLPYPDADKLIAVRTGLQDRADFPASAAEYLDYRNDSETAEAVGAWAIDTTTMRIGDGDPEVVRFAAITPSVQSILGLTTPLGRPFLEEEGNQEAPDVVVLSHSFWASRFGEDPDVLERRDVSIGGTPYRIVGVAAAGFALPGDSPSIHVPLQLPETSEELGTRSSHFLNVVARLHRDVRFDQAVAESRRLMTVWEEEYRGGHVLHAENHPIKLQRLGEWALGDVWESIRMIIWGAALVMLLACVNLSSLMLARGETRKLELGVRSALGAGFGRLARMVMIESTTLALAGGVVGLGLSAALLQWVGTRTVGAMRVGANSLDAASVDLRLAFFTILLAAMCGIAFGILPAAAAKRIDVARLLSTEGGRSRSGSRGLRRGFNSLVFVQLALAAVLLNGTVILVDGFVQVTKLSPGFVAEDRFAFRVRMAESEYPNGEPVLSFYDRAREAISGIPGVESVAATRALPMRSLLGTEGFIHEGDTFTDDAAPPQVDFQTVSPDYYGTMGIPLLAGREFDERDRAGSPRVAMVNRAAAVAYFGSVREALGSRIVPLFMGGPEADPFTIVGVSEDVRHLGPIGEVRPELALPIAQAEGWVFSVLRRGELVVRVRPGMTNVLPEVRATMKAIAPGVPIDEPGWMSEAVAESVAYERFLAELTTGFGVLALMIAAVGVLGVVWFGVNTRWREFGVRMALGQTAPSIIGLVMVLGLKLGVGGAVVGAAATMAMHRIIESVVPLSGDVDLTLVALSSAVLLGCVAIACVVPAMRAGSLDPARVLGAE